MGGRNSTALQVTIGRLVLLLSMNDVRQRMEQNGQQDQIMQGLVMKQFEFKFEVLGEPLDGLQQEVEYQPWGSCRKILLIEWRTGWEVRWAGGTRGQRPARPSERCVIRAERRSWSRQPCYHPIQSTESDISSASAFLSGQLGQSGVPWVEGGWVLNLINCSQLTFPGVAGRGKEGFSLSPVENYLA